MGAVSSVLAIRGLAAGAAFLATVLVARQLGPERYGPFAVLFSIVTIVMGLTGPALDTSLVRFASRHIGPEGDRSAPYFKIVLQLKSAVGVLLMLFGLVGARPLMHLLFREATAEAIAPAAMVLAFAGGVTMTLWGLAQSYFLAHQRYRTYAGFMLLNSLLRLGFVVVLVWANVKSVLTMLCAYVAAPILVTGAAWSRLPLRFLRAPVQREQRHELYHFAKWVVLASLFTCLAQRADLLLLGYFGIAEERLGHYGAALNLVLLGDLVVLTFYDVLLPKASRLTTAGEMALFLRRFRGPALLGALAMAPVLAVSGPLSRLTFGSAYAETGALFAILLCGTLASVAATPAVTAAYGLGRAWIVACLEGARLLLCVLIGMWIAPRYGAVGMAWAVAGIRASVAVAMYVLTSLTIMRRQGIENSEKNE